MMQFAYENNKGRILWLPQTIAQAASTSLASINKLEFHFTELKDHILLIVGPIPPILDWSRMEIRRYDIKWPYHCSLSALGSFSICI